MRAVREMHACSAIIEGALLTLRPRLLVRVHMRQAKNTCLSREKYVA